MTDLDTDTCVTITGGNATDVCDALPWPLDWICRLTPVVR